MGHWTDALLDWAHDAGAPVCWGTINIATGGKLRRNHWVNVQLPDKNVEHRGLTLDSAAWAVLAEIEPDPLDKPEA